MTARRSQGDRTQWARGGLRKQYVHTYSGPKAIDYKLQTLLRKALDRVCKPRGTTYIDHVAQILCSDDIKDSLAAWKIFAPYIFSQKPPPLPEEDEGLNGPKEGDREHLKVMPFLKKG